MGVFLQPKPTNHTLSQLYGIWVKSIGNRTGNPGVIQGYPYPYPPNTRTCAEGTGGGYDGLGRSKNPCGF